MEPVVNVLASVQQFVHLSWVPTKPACRPLSRPNPDVINRVAGYDSSFGPRLPNSHRPRRRALDRFPLAMFGVAAMADDGSVCSTWRGVTAPPHQIPNCRRPRRPVAVKRLRRYCASLRPLRGDCDGPARQGAFQVALLSESGQGPLFVSNATKRERPLSPRAPRHAHISAKPAANHPGPSPSLSPRRGERGAAAPFFPSPRLRGEVG